MDSKIIVNMKQLAPLIEDQLANGTDATIFVTGTSMRPLFRDGCDRVVLTACDPASLKKGDVPFYRRENGQYVLHRIVGRDDDGYRLLGDGQTVIEYGIKPEQIIGVMAGFYRGKRYMACTALRYRLYVWLWTVCKPFRRYLLAIYRRCVREKTKN